MTHRSIRLLPVFALIVLVACARDPAGSAHFGTAEAPVPVAQPASVARPAPVAFAGFRVEVALSSAAREKLAKDKETIIVSADYFGTPVAAAADQADEVGQLDLGKAQHELAQAGVVDFDQAGFLSDKAGLIDGPPEVNINVYSGRHASPDNLLDCDFFQDTLAAAARVPIKLSCKLIGEP